jgi:hypothetical protein
VRVSLRRIEDTPAQQLKVGASIHLPLETLQFIHLALGLPIVVGQRQEYECKLKAAGIESSDCDNLGLLRNDPF